MESRRDAQRVCDRHRAGGRPAGRRARDHGAPDPADGPGRRLPPVAPRRAGPALRSAQGPLPDRSGRGDRLRHGVRRGLGDPRREGHRRAGLPAGRPLPPGGPRLRGHAGPRHRLRRHQSPRRAGAQRPPRQRAGRGRRSRRGWHQAPRGGRPRRGPQRLPRLREPGLPRRRDDGEPGGRRGPRPHSRAPGRPAPRALLRTAGRQVAVRPHRRPDHPRARRRGAPRRRGRAGPRRAGLRLRRSHAAELPERPDPRLPGRHPRGPLRPGHRRAGRAHLGHPADRRCAAHPERTPGPGHPDARLEARPGHARGVGRRQQLPDRRRTLRAAEPLELRDPAQAGDRARPLRAARGHRRAARPAVGDPLGARHPDDVRARAAGAGPLRAAPRGAARGHRGAGAARRGRGAAPGGLRADPAGRGAGDPEEGRRPRHRHLGRAAHRPGDLPCGNVSPSTTPRPAHTRA